MIHLLYMLREEMQEVRMRGYESDHRLRYLENKSEMVFDYIRLMFEATEVDYQTRLEFIGFDDIKKYTLAEVESARFMNDRQFNNLRASKRV